jgi:hypothetical protein
MQIATRGECTKGTGDKIALVGCMQAWFLGARVFWVLVP